MDAVAREQWALAVLTARFDCAQQKFFQAEYGRRRRSPAVALALCLTLGAFGAHEFYLGRLLSAALRLLFCWTGIPLLLSLWDALSITGRVHAYNTRTAHVLAEIIEESFAAVRAQERADASQSVAPVTPVTPVMPDTASAAPVAPVVTVAPAPRVTIPLAVVESRSTPLERPQSSDWRLGVARTLAPMTARLWSQREPEEALAEERMASAVVDFAPMLASASSAARRAPTTVRLPESEFAHTTAPLSRREWKQLSPSLDALLADLSALADDMEAQRASPPEAPVESAPQLHSQGEQDDSLPNYAKMMAPEEPLAAIMGAGPVSESPAPTIAPTIVAPRLQRITVRKVAMYDGAVIAEARATRDVVLEDASGDLEARIAAATDEAREEALRVLAQLVPSEMLAPGA